jgi:hypothetical protein
MSKPIKMQAGAISLPEDFEFGEVDPSPMIFRAAIAAVPSLGPLEHFVGTWNGAGFNTIFRPDNAVSASSMKLPHPLPAGDNLLELNLTSETMTFSKSLGTVPNRGLGQQADVLLNGVPYLQVVNDVTTPGQSTGIHVEPGIWIFVPATTTNPVEGPTLARMASIPHGTTIEAQGTFTSVPTGPSIPSVDITPFATPLPSGIPTDPQPRLPKFLSQTASQPQTARIPQDLTSFSAAGLTAQNLLDNPNSLIQTHAAGLTITETITISVSTQPAAPPVITGIPQFGGGTDNIAFLLGDGNQPVANRPNAQTLQMTATFWIETVEYTLDLPASKPHKPPFLVKPAPPVLGQPMPTFLVPAPPKATTAPLQKKFSATQIQYSQTVLLNFNGLTWPHVSVATLVPKDPITVPVSIWS